MHSAPLAILLLAGALASSCGGEGPSAERNSTDGPGSGDPVGGGAGGTASVGGETDGPGSDGSTTGAGGTGTGVGGSGAGAGSGTGGSGVGGTDGSVGEGGAAGADSEEPPVVPPPDPKPVAPGQLTVGAWDDNDNFEFFEEYRNNVHERYQSGVMPLSVEEHREANDAVQQARKAHETLDVALVIDTTGSMGDELDYLQSEFDDISETVQARHPNAEQRWSLVVYRDQGDEYVTRSVDFTNDMDAFRSSLAEQSYGGGGDYPEAPDAALADAAELSWRSDTATARLLFWVADAPHHDDRAEAMAEAVRGVRDQGIHVYPVASSGVDELTEFSMRAAAQITLGRYLFLTDDSGIGGSHKEPTIPCYWVTLLNQAIVRVIDLEMSGEYAPPNEQDIIRVGGAMNEEGYCTWGNGTEVKPF